MGNYAVLVDFAMNTSISPNYSFRQTHFSNPPEQSLYHNYPIPLVFPNTQVAGILPEASTGYNHNLEVKTEYKSLPPKKTRVIRACDRCRQRKQKCDGNRPCGSCTNNQDECIYREVQPPKADPHIQHMIDSQNSIQEELSLLNKDREKELDELRALKDRLCLLEMHKEEELSQLKDLKKELGLLKVFKTDEFRQLKDLIVHGLRLAPPLQYPTQGVPDSHFTLYTTSQAHEFHEFCELGAE